MGSDDSNSTGPKVLVYEFSESGRRWIRVESIMTINDAVSGELLYLNEVPVIQTANVFFYISFIANSLEK